MTAGEMFWEMRVNRQVVTGLANRRKLDPKGPQREMIFKNPGALKA